MELDIVKKYGYGKEVGGCDAFYFGNMTVLEFVYIKRVIKIMSWNHLTLKNRAFNGI